MAEREQLDAYEGCPLFAEHGACFCSTGVLGDCPVPVQRPSALDAFLADVLDDVVNGA